jgi:hypothetical protein
MKKIALAGIGFALAGAAFALVNAPASAFETPALISKAPSNITKVEDRDHERCERVRRACRERHHEREREFRDCVTRDRCEP